MDYKELTEASDKLNERKDCAVIAVAAACQVSYNEAHEALKLFGRLNKKGTNFAITHAAIRYLGYRLIELESIKNGHQLTPRTISQVAINGLYICRTRGHIFAVKDGQVLDWTKNRCHRIKKFYKIEKRFEMRFK